jgi:hypothetical protein
MGLLRTAGRVAVASSVHGRVQRRQQQRWAAQDQGATQAPPQAPPQAAATSTADLLEQLTQRGKLRDAGVLTDEEFELQKARILGA